MTVFEELKRRGLIAQMTNEEGIEKALSDHSVTFYIGFDATADSLHVGHFLQLVVMRHLQRAGHRPVALLGTGTTMVGDPSGRNDMRKMLTVDEINRNAERFREQISRFLDFSDGKALMVKNGDWLLHLNYIEFLRDVGVHFSVNRMLAAECVKSRLEVGLTFIEFNYMIMQSYDFLELFRRVGCEMQLGGDDQWSNIIMGADLIRRVEGKEAFGMTFTLLTTKEGKKMGKTEKGALWLDPDKTSPHEFFQYWRNVDDGDVIKCLKLITFLPVEEIEAMESWQGSELNRAKEILAFEVTKLVHGEAEAQKALEGARALFVTGGDTDNMPTSEIPASELGGMTVVDLLVRIGLAPSKGEARRLIQGGGVAVGDTAVSDPFAAVDAAGKGQLIVRRGKKTFHKVVLTGE